MPEQALTTEEQKYFDTKGAAAPPAEKPAEEADKTAKPEDTVTGDDGGKDNAGRFVRLQALHEERDRRKELQAELGEERRLNTARNARLEERLAILGQVL